MFLFSDGIMLGVNVEQRANVKFCVKLGKSATETYDFYVQFWAPDDGRKTRLKHVERPTEISNFEKLHLVGCTLRIYKLSFKYCSSLLVDKLF